MFLGESMEASSELHSDRWGKPHHDSAARSRAAHIIVIIFYTNLMKRAIGVSMLLKCDRDYVHILASLSSKNHRTMAWQTMTSKTHTKLASIKLTREEDNKRGKKNRKKSIDISDTCRIRTCALSEN